MIQAVFVFLAIAGGFLGGIALNEYLHRKKEEAREALEFALYLSEARDNFVTKIWELHPTPETRVTAENILIAFDQMRDRLNLGPEILKHQKEREEALNL